MKTTLTETLHQHTSFQNLSNQKEQREHVKILLTNGGHPLLLSELSAIPVLDIVIDPSEDKVP